MKRVEGFPQLPFPVVDLASDAPRLVGARSHYGVNDYLMSNRSRFMTLSHAFTKSRTNFSLESSWA